MTDRLTSHYGDVGPGWAAILTMLHAELDKTCPEYSVIQVKEKLGGLRAYIRVPQTEGIPPGGERSREAYALEYKYEALSLTVCEYCGKYGENKPGPLGTGGWWKTLCAQHRQRWADEGPMWKWREENDRSA